MHVSKYILARAYALVGTVTLLLGLGLAAHAVFATAPEIATDSARMATTAGGAASAVTLRNAAPATQLTVCPPSLGWVPSPNMDNASHNLNAIKIPALDTFGNNWAVGNYVTGGVTLTLAVYTGCCIFSSPNP